MNIISWNREAELIIKTEKKEQKLAENLRLAQRLAEKLQKTSWKKHKKLKLIKKGTNTRNYQRKARKI